MKKACIFLLAAVILLASSPSCLLACTTFCFRDGSGRIVFGKNLDYSAGSAHVSVNKRNMAKVSRIAAPEKPMSWTSKYGSITFNMLGKEFAQGGMNEAGLVIESLLVSQGKLPEQDDRPGLIMQQWIQYQLDTSATVEDVLRSDGAVRMSFLYPRVVHFLVGDRHGNVAVVEYVDGKLKVATGDSLPCPVLTNAPYEASAQYALGDHGEAKAPFPGNPFENSLPRFALAAGMVKDIGQDVNGVDHGFALLDAARLEGDRWGTRWSIVYDITGGRIHYKTASNADVRTVDMKDFDYDCASPAHYVDIDAPVQGRGSFQPYSLQANRDLIERSFNSIPNLRDVPASERDARAAYPDSVRCAGAKN